MGESGAARGSCVHAVAVDQVDNEQTTGESSLLGGGRLGAFRCTRKRNWRLIFALGNQGWRQRTAPPCDKLRLASVRTGHRPSMLMEGS
jgi:hypothetical protein